MRRDLSEIQYRQRLAAVYPLTRERREWNRRHMRRCRASFIAGALHRLRRGLPFDRGLLTAFVRVDPHILVAAPLEVARAVKGWFLGGRPSSTA
jgi:hypothetical protein